jgi:hypothetical protein
MSYVFLSCGSRDRALIARMNASKCRVLRTGLRSQRIELALLRPRVGRR